MKILRMLELLGGKRSPVLLLNDEIKRGTRFIVKKQVEVGLIIEYKGPYSDGERINLSVGECIEAINDSPANRIAFSCMPCSDWDIFEKKYVPPQYLQYETYSGYHLVVYKKEIKQTIELI